MEEFYDDDSSYEDEWVDPDALADTLEDEELEEMMDTGERPHLPCFTCGVDDYHFLCLSCRMFFCEDCVEEDGLCPACEGKLKDVSL